MAFSVFAGYSGDVLSTDSTWTLTQTINGVSGGSEFGNALAYSPTGAQIAIAARMIGILAANDV